MVRVQVLHDRCMGLEYDMVDNGWVLDGDRMIGKLTITVIGPEKLIKEFMQDVEGTTFDYNFGMHSFKWAFSKADEALEGEITESESKTFFKDLNE